MKTRLFYLTAGLLGLLATIPVGSGCEGMQALGTAGRMRQGAPGPDDETRGDVSQMVATPLPTPNRFPNQ